MTDPTRQILQQVQDGALSVDDALLALKTEPYEDLGFAKIDLHRQLRQGTPEVIYGAGKTPREIADIVERMRSVGQNHILITRLEPEAADEISRCIPLTYHERAKIAGIGEPPEPDGIGYVLLATGGTSDIPVAEEAAVTAEFFGNEVRRVYDVGVAGLHRLLAHKEEIMQAAVVIAVAGMEGALASVVGGLAACPVIAVPTGVGYGAAFHGLSALLSMLNSCASGVAVVNIDNGFGAGMLAHRINHMGRTS